MIVVLLSVVNVVGVRESARLNFLLAVIDFATQLLLLLLGVFLVLNFETLIDNIHLWQAPTVSDFVLSITIAMISYTGIETISNLAEEAREPRRLIPRSMAFVVLAVMVIYTGLPAVALSALPVTRDGRRLHDGARDHLRGRPDPRRRREHEPRRLPDRRWSTTSGCWRRRSC